MGFFKNQKKREESHFRKKEEDSTKIGPGNEKQVPGLGKLLRLLPNMELLQ